MKLACSPVTPVKASLAEVNEVKALRLLWSFRGLRARVADPPALRVPGKSNPSIREANGNGAKKSALPTLVHHQDKTSTRSPFSVALLWFVISIFQNKTEWSKTEVDHQGWSNLIMCQNWNPQPSCTTRHNDGIVVPSMTLAAQQDLARHATRKVSLMSLTVFWIPVSFKRRNTCSSQGWRESNRRDWNSLNPLPPRVKALVCFNSLVKQ